MNLCQQCGRRHPAIRVTVVASWAWVRDEAVVRDIQKWINHQRVSHTRIGGPVVYSRVFQRRVRAGGAVFPVTVAVLSTRAPWHTSEV